MTYRDREYEQARNDAAHQDSLGEQADRDWRELFGPCANEQARDELADACRVPGPVRDAYIEYQNYHGPMARRWFVVLLERDRDDLWTECVESILTSFAMAGGEAA